MSLNLENFETDFARDTPYILSSPTSLKACSTLDILPNELLYHGLEEYEERLSGIPLSEIYQMYEENETKRQEKLLKCREQRLVLKGQSQVQGPDEEQEKISLKDEKRGSSLNRKNNEEVSSSTRKGRSATIMTPRSGKTKRFTSAPGMNRSPQRKQGQSVNFQLHHNNLKDIDGCGGGSAGNLSRSRSSSGKLFLQTSDTESTEEVLNGLFIGDPFYDCRSVPNLLSVSKSNLDFRKLSASPRQLCPCNWDIQDRDVLSSYLKQYGDILNSPDLSPEDRKIMECLVLKRGREIEFERKSQETRKLIDKERTRRWTENQMIMQSWQDKLSEKRKMESIENTKRYLEQQEKAQDSRCNLMRYLEERDRKVQKYLEDMNYKKKKGMLEKQKREALRQLEVGKAIEKLVEDDRQHRQILRDKLQRRMEEADVRKRRRERSYYRHVQELNRMEDVKRSLKLERIEQQSRESLAELKNQLEEKEHRANLNYLNRIRLRNRALSEDSGNRKKTIEKVQAIHADLLKGLDEWHQRVLALQLETQKRAEKKYNEEIHRRRIRVASDRILREERSTEMLKRVHHFEEQKMDLLKATIESKESKTARIKEDKDRKVQISRIRAQHAAELRQQLKDKIYPETFDRKAARAELELRFMKKCYPTSASSIGVTSWGPGVRFKTISKRCSSCYSNRRNSFSRQCNHCSSANPTNTRSRGGGPLKSAIMLG